MLQHLITSLSLAGLLAGGCLTANAAADSLSTNAGKSMNKPAGSVMYFDIEAKNALIVDGLDVQLLNGNPGANVVIWKRDGTWLGNQSSNGGWSQVASGTIPSPKSSGLSSVVLDQLIGLDVGTHGFMIHYLGDGQGFDDGLFPIGGKIGAQNADMIIFEGGAGNAPFTGLSDAPRLAALTVHYDLGQPCAGFAQYGFGQVPGLQPNALTLDGIGSGFLGSNYTLRTTGLPQSAPGAFFGASASTALLPFNQQLLLIDVTQLAMPVLAVPKSPFASGTAEVDLSIPATPSLAGAVIYFQSAARDPLLGLALSNGLSLTLCQ